MRVVVLGHTAALGGAELALARLLAHLPPDIQVHTILFAHGPLEDELRRAGLRVTVLPLDSSLTTANRHAVGGTVRSAMASAARVLPFAIRLGRVIRRISPDVVHTTTLKADLIGIPAAWIARRPLVWHVHDRIAPDYLPGPMVHLIRFLARHVPRHVLVNSEATAATLTGTRRLTTAYPGFSPEQVGASPAGRTPPDPPVVGILGRISPTKGQLVFARAATLVLAARPETRFRVMGTPLFGEEGYEREVRAAVDTAGIADHFEFAGFVADAAAALDQLTLCVHASPTPEPFGQVIVEAMVRGVPVIATTGGGVTEIVRPDADPLGWLVPPDDDAALARTILEALSDPVEARRRAQAAWVSSQARFPIAETVAAVTQVWRSVARPYERRQVTSRAPGQTPCVR